MTPNDTGTLAVIMSTVASESIAKQRYLDALAFAESRHRAVKQARKGTDFPYLVHPLRVAEILDRFQCTEDAVVAALLHDTVEDAGASYDEIASSFGDRVAQLVEHASEPDKSLPWETRKQHTIDSAKTENDLDALDLVAADKLDNIRALQDTLRARGAKQTWAIFNADEKKQQWYYRTLAAALLERKPESSLMRTLDWEVHMLFPDPRRRNPFFSGRVLGNPQDARAYLADPIKHWRPDYSAYELATAWLAHEATPSKADALLKAAYSEYEIVEGFFEKQTELDAYGRPSQTDLLLLLTTEVGFAVVGVEAKAREPFGPLVSEWQGARGRLNGLCEKLGIAPDAVADVRYQLLHRTVATLLEARRYRATEALMLVQSFDAGNASFGDYERFAHLLGVDGIAVNAVTTAREIDGVTLRLAWAGERSSSVAR